MSPEPAYPYFESALVDSGYVEIDRAIYIIGMTNHMVGHDIDHQIHSTVVQGRGQIFEVVFGAVVRIQRIAVE